MTSLPIKKSESNFKYLKNKCSENLVYTSAIYCLTYKSIIVYVGQSRDLRERLLQHIRTGTKLFDDFLFVRHSAGDKARLLAEDVLIKALLPVYNKEYNTNYCSRVCEFHKENNVKYVDAPSLASFFVDDRKEDILHYYDVGLSLRKLADKYECSFNTMKKHLDKWEIERGSKK